jgi:hypothetical protein
MGHNLDPFFDTRRDMQTMTIQITNVLFHAYQLELALMVRTTTVNIKKDKLLCIVDLQAGCSILMLLLLQPSYNCILVSDFVYICS